ncbi:phosphoglucomutase (alpha-D-glucose-1,6-bisphosphate-dependent) [Shewanella litorisediminis]|uniref:Phosphoglucomutase n=1 Tax=Shewanella litorisediminis TaxID=1173586 RepID=A0ABX7G803_9GAMM|nr:phosphoglucomutase (alpha-D-glucose-1,6-bisphosphate-dependent) [Shewanella litorisediminis]MCL2919158.1 phosphoglucomutase (alpha-D-glucose-1,6-bisphosphate-dependent) [Shewanella litorisediminis]QRH03405.1 alpha-D-glucose phosphate-specific phosphoglucomutase [Shewanella litorisediminis]
MAIHDRAGTQAQQGDLVNIPKLMSHYYRLLPDANDPAQKVSFGTSGHRGCAFHRSFNEQHILAIAQAVVDWRTQAGITGPLYLGMDTHALSQAAYLSVIEVLIANKVQILAQRDDGYTPTPVVSQAIVAANRQQTGEDAVLSDGIIITPSHNPPQDGGIKYNPPHGGPAEGEITSWIESRANYYLAHGLDGVRRVNYGIAAGLSLLKHVDLVSPYVESLAEVIDMAAIAKSGVRIGVDPLGGSGIHYWQPIARHYGLDITVVNQAIDPTFGFMPLDKDGKIRMDCSSPYAMAGLLVHKDKFDICVGNDPDYDRHGIVCPGSGLMDPNHYLAVAIDYLLGHRPQWAKTLSVGKTLVSSSLIDKVCAAHHVPLMEVPVGFKWFVDGLADGSVCFGGEESAGAAFLKMDGSTWCTDKDGFILALLAAEILAVTGQTPAERYEELVAEHGRCFYKRIDSPLNPKMKAKFGALNAETLGASSVAGDAITAVLTKAPGNGAAIGGIKVCTDKGWFAARPSGTEPLFKLYAESFVSESHLAELISDAQNLLGTALKAIK